MLLVYLELSEMYDPDGAMALGNFPQAYSHAAFIELAVFFNEHQNL